LPVHGSVSDGTDDWHVLVVVLVGDCHRDWCCCQSSEGCCQSSEGCCGSLQSSEGYCGSLPELYRARDYGIYCGLAWGVCLVRRVLDCQEQGC
jgi:hypothetical protein